jgi:hypothetical protein
MNMRTIAMCFALAGCLPWVGFRAAAASDELPALVRVRAEFVKMPEVRFEELMFGDGAPATDSALWQEVCRLVDAGEAEMVESMAGVGYHAKDIVTKSVREVIHPTEFERADCPHEVLSTTADGVSALLPRDFATGPTPSAWDKRDVGSILTVTPTIDRGGGSVTLRLNASLSYHMGNEIWEEWNDPRGSAHVQMPVFHTVECITTVRTAVGKPLLVAALTPKGAEDAPDPASRILLFVTADVLTLKTEAAPPAKPSPKPRLVRTRVEFIAVSHARYRELVAAPATIADDSALRQQIGKLMATGEAEMVECMMTTGRPETKLNTASVTDFYYAIEYDPGEHPRTIRLTPAQAADKARLPDLATGPTPSAWDIRNLGPALTTHASVFPSGTVVDLEMETEITRYFGDFEWRGWKDGRSHAPITMPEFHTMAGKLELATVAGRYLMVAALSPADAKGFTDTSRKIMVFVKTEILTTNK